MGAAIGVIVVVLIVGGIAWSQISTLKSRQYPRSNPPPPGRSSPRDDPSAAPPTDPDSSGGQ
jgi:hypothetical protein